MKAKENSILERDSIPENILENVKKIAENCQKKKGVYTVLVTLLYYKTLNPNQDIRLHQERFEGGFSGRGFDSKFVTPVLKKCGLPAMAESGWLTRSLEQPYPYDFKYNGAIGFLKMPFLETLDFVQKNENCAKNLLIFLLKNVISVSQSSIVKINPIKDAEKLTIEKIVEALSKHFLFQYGTHGGAKLPVLAFYALYSNLIQELKRYENCTLAPLSSLTASDKNNETPGDIEIFKNGNVFESIEIKLNKKIDSQILRIARDKIYKWNPNRYYILSVLGIESAEKCEIEKIVSEVSKNHGCQIIINGLIPSIRYYLRLVENLAEFVEYYSHLVEIDCELQKAHKEKWNELLSELE